MASRRRAPSGGVVAPVVPGGGGSIAKVDAPANAATSVD
jgi:hypothetical protein